jgi:hypothetical protein
VSVVCCQVEVSATGWSLVQRSPTDCVVSQMCVTMKPRRNEEAQAHIGLSSHREENGQMRDRITLQLSLIDTFHILNSERLSTLKHFSARFLQIE